jgi:hypothetical protein
MKKKWRLSADRYSVLTLQADRSFRIPFLERLARDVPSRKNRSRLGYLCLAVAHTITVCSNSDDGAWRAMTIPILTIYNTHTEHCGIPPSVCNNPPGAYIGYFENPFGDQWIFTFDFKTRAATLRGGDIGWDRECEVRDGRVDGIILGKEELAWLGACCKAASG